MDDVRVIYRKYDGSLHWNLVGNRLGEDGHGVWVGVPVTAQVFKGELLTGPVEAVHVVCLPRDGWWTATFNAEPHRTEVYCDVTTVPHWEDRTVSMVDLDLDVVRRRAGNIYVDDEDEFATHQVMYAYPPHVVTAARQAADWLLGAVTERAEPFGSTFRHWLEKAAQAGV